MGFLDVLRGMQNGPRGARDHAATTGGMSPITMAVLGLLAYKAVKHFSGNPVGQGAGPAPDPAATHPGTAAMLGGLSRELPQAVDELTPDGRIPSEQEAAQMI